MVTLPDELVIEVTEFDIKNGTRGDCHDCAVARAVRRIPGIEAAEVGHIDGIIVQYRMDNGISNIRAYKMPGYVHCFIARFDDGVSARYLKPFTFTAEAEAS